VEAAPAAAHEMRIYKRFSFPRLGEHKEEEKSDYESTHAANHARRRSGVNSKSGGA
jgi:hypothetical protein